MIANLRDGAFLSARRGFPFIISLAVVLFLITNLPWELDDYDQGQQAFASFEMVKEGHWFYQRTPHEPIAQKPPLIGWISAAFFSITQCWNVAWRLPSLLATAAIMITLYRAALVAYGNIPAFIGISAFSLNLLTTRLATMVRTDMPLALWIFLLGLMIFDKVRRRHAWSRADRWLFFLLLTASLWTKGPFAYWFILPAVVLFQWRFRTLSNVSAWCGWWPWLVALALFAVWIVAGIYFIPRFYEEIVAFEFLTRLNPAVHRAEPVYFYLAHLLHKFAPWSILMIALAVLVGKARTKPLLRDLSPDVFWLIAWAMGGLILMSLIPSKRVDRIYACIPPLSLLLSAQVAWGLSQPQLRLRVERWCASAVVISAVFATGYSVLKVISGYHGGNDALERFSTAVQKEALVHHWRYEVVLGNTSGRDGMLLYLQKPGFLDAETAVAEWNSGQIDALIVPREKMPLIMGRLQNANVSSLSSPARKKMSDPGYRFIVRSV